MITKLLTSLVLTFMLASLCVAQQNYAYGKPSDLKGLKKVYVNTGPDTQSRDAIIKELEKSKLSFEIVDDVEEAEIRLAFEAGVAADAVVGSVNGDRVTLQERYSRTGVGVIVVQGRDKDRIIHSFRSTQESGPTFMFKRKPVTNFAREFVKIYKKANNLK